MDPLDKAAAYGIGDEYPADPPPTDEVALLSVDSTTLQDWLQVAQWAAAEGWNPGHRDANCFHPTDPDGFFLGRIGGYPISSVSVVNYATNYAFLGFYLVHPEHRGNGIGLATWRAGMLHAGDRLVGLDAVPAQRDTYRRSGFIPAYDTTRYAGVPVRSGAPAAGVVPVGPEHLAAVAAFDRPYFPVERASFVERWLTADGHRARVRLVDGQVTGYGVVRPAQSGWRVGPLFANDRAGAEALFDALVADVPPGEPVFVDVPEPHTESAALATSRGLGVDSVTTRMYTGPAPATKTAGIWAVTSLELG